MTPTPTPTPTPPVQLHPYTACLPPTYPSLAPYFDGKVQALVENASELSEAVKLASSPDADAVGRKKAVGDAFFASGRIVKMLNTTKMLKLRVPDSALIAVAVSALDGATARRGSGFTLTRPSRAKLLKAFAFCVKKKTSLVSHSNAAYSRKPGLEVDWRVLWSCLLLDFPTLTSPKASPHPSCNDPEVAGLRGAYLAAMKASRRFFPNEDDSAARQIWDEFAPGLAELHTSRPFVCVSFLRLLLPPYSSKAFWAGAVEELLVAHEGITSCNEWDESFLGEEERTPPFPLSASSFAPRNN